jgi:hypothetical protein
VAELEEAHGGAVPRGGMVPGSGVHGDEGGAGDESPERRQRGGEVGGSHLLHWHRRMHGGGHRLPLPLPLSLSSTDA